MAWPCVGIVVDGTNAATAVNEIVRAERAGVGQVWMTQPGRGAVDAIGCLTAAAVRTETIGLGTAITPVFGRHPVVVAEQVLAISDLAPDRFRLGLGTSHTAIVEHARGIPRRNTLSYLEEYIAVLRPLVEAGKVNHRGTVFNVVAALPRASQVPILTAALSLRGFAVAGRLADAALSWACPIPYLLGPASEAMAAGAAEAGRPLPRLIAHVPVALHRDRGAAHLASVAMFRRHAAMPAYARMFSDAGYDLRPDGEIPDDLIDNVVVMGTGPQLVDRLRALLDAGIDELMLSSLVVADVVRERAALRELAASLSSDTLLRAGRAIRYAL
jgi:alkanesulfonate monooxygenase SsuD/methylene tetrahydromethanopterin reductase-like flavin-dependent oxidoreductase (luciferase family)